MLKKNIFLDLLRIDDILTNKNYVSLWKEEIHSK